MSETCPNCGGERWVCENHPDKAWNAQGCECGAGMPCRICNPCTREIPPAMPPGFRDDLDGEGEAL